jgi:hypothetical protein
VHAEDPQIRLERFRVAGEAVSGSERGSNVTDGLQRQCGRPGCLGMLCTYHRLFLVVGSPMVIVRRRSDGPISVPRTYAHHTAQEGAPRIVPQRM